MVQASAVLSLCKKAGITGGRIRQAAYGFVEVRGPEAVLDRVTVAAVEAGLGIDLREYFEDEADMDPTSCVLVIMSKTVEAEMHAERAEQAQEIAAEQAYHRHMEDRECYRGEPEPW